MSGADLEFARMQRAAGINPASPAGYDGARMEQLADIRYDTTLVTVSNSGQLGLFVDIDSPTIDESVDLVHTSGFNSYVLGAGSYQYDVDVDEDYVTDNPLSSFIAEDGRGFKLVPRYVSPFTFGAVGDAVTNDSPAWQAFLTFCELNDVGNAYVDGNFALETGLELGIYGTSATLFFSGRCVFSSTATGGGEYMLKLSSAGQLYWEYFKATGRGSVSNWSSRSWQVALHLDVTSRTLFNRVIITNFAFAGIWAGDGNNSLNNYGEIKVTDCGSGAVSGATHYGLTTTWSGEVQAGIATSVNQNSTIDITTLPPSYILDSTYGVIGASVLMLRITLNTGVTRLFYVNSIDQGAMKANVFPWIGNGNTAVAADWVFGGGLVLYGSDSNVVSFDGIDAIRCGIALNCGSLYPPTAKRVTTQFCGTAITFGKDPGGACLGGLIAGVYTESNTEDIIAISRPGGGNVYFIIESEYALNLAKCYSVGNTRSAVGVENGTASSFFGNRISYRGRLLQGVAKPGLEWAYIGSSLTIEVNRTEQFDLHVRNTTTFNYFINNDVNRLTGIDHARLRVLGTGTNKSPTTVTFGVPVGNTPAGVAWTLNGGAVAVAYTGFDGPTDFMIRFDYVTGDAIVTRITPRGSATTAQLIAKADQINTVNKVAGRMVFNTTTSKPVYATGATDVSTWVDATGALAHTPV